MSFNVFLTEHACPSPETRERIEKLLPVLRVVADNFRVNVKMDCLDGPLSIPAESESDTVSLHIDSYPDWMLMESTVMTSAFGLIPAGEVSISVPVRNNLRKIKSLQTDIYDLKGNNLGCIVGNRIFIYPRVLTGDGWSNEAREELLQAIIYWSMPWAVSNIPGSETFIDPALKVLRGEIKKGFMASNPREDVRKKFNEFMVKANSKMVDDLAGKTEVLEKEIEELSGKYFEAISKNISDKAKFEAIKNEVGKRDYGEEFESILAMESIETVRVDDGRYIIIKTCPVMQVPDPDTGSEFDIGEFVIRIDSNPSQQSGLSRSNIAVNQPFYTGPYRHFHAGVDVGANYSICYGTLLNGILDKLMASFKIRPVVNLILTFLKREKNVPPERQNWDAKSGPKPASYTDAADREDAKQKFIRLISEAVLRTSVQTLEKDIIESEKKIESLRQNIFDLQVELGGANLALNNAITFLYSNPEIDSEADKLIDDESIFRVDISDRHIAIYFYYDRGDNSGGYLPKDFVIKVNLDTMPELFIPLSKRTLQRIPIIYLRSGKIKDGDEVIVGHIRSGRISEILRIAKFRISNHVFEPKHPPKAGKESRG